MNENQVGEAGRLLSQAANLQSALAGFEGDQPLTAFMVGRVRVDAADMQYPQQMLDAIKAQLQQQLTTLQQRLTELGVNMEPAPQAPQAAPAAARTAPAPQPTGRGRTR